MAFDFNKVIINTGYSSKTINNETLTDSKVKDGIIKDSDFKSKTTNSLLLKLSNSVKSIEENGITSYIKGKKYRINDIVSVVYRDLNNNLFPSLLICIGTNNDDDTCDIVPSKNFEIDDNGNIIFYDSRWASPYWKEIRKNSETTYQYEATEFEFSYSLNPDSRDSLQAKHILIADFSDVEETDYSYINFNISINRYSNVFIDCSFSGNKSNVKLTVNTINNIVNAHSETSGSLWDDKSIFKYVALNGMFFTVDEENAKLYLTYLGAEVKNADSFNVIATINEANKKIQLNPETITNFIDNDFMVIVPFTIGSSNEFSGSTMKIYDYAYSLSNKEQFKNGLRPITTEETFDKFVYPIFRKVQLDGGSKFEPKVYDLDGKYRLMSNENQRYFQAKFPDLVGKPKTTYINNSYSGGWYLLQQGTGYSYRGNTNGGPAKTKFEGDLNTTRKSTNPVNNDGFDSGRPKFIYRTVDPNTGNYTDWNVRSNYLVGEEMFNSSDSEPNRITVQSGFYTPYIKLW